MSLLRRIRNLSRFLIHRRELERELDDELRSYLDIAAEENLRKGLSEDEPTRAARLQIGGLEQVKEADRASRIGSGLDSILVDLRYAFRTLQKNPRSTAVIVITLALGIGAATVVFSVVNAVLLRPLPYADSDQLVWVWSMDSDNPLKQRVSYPDFMDWKAESKTLDLVGYSSIKSILTGVGEPQRLMAELTIGNLFTLLGVPPLLGTTVGVEGMGREEPLVVLSYGLWRRSFNSDPDVLGRSITLNGLIHTVTAVMPADFQFPIEPTNPRDLWVPLERFNPALADQRGARLIEVVGRLRSNVTFDQAQAEMDLIASNLSRQYPDTNGDLGVRLIPAMDEVTGDVSYGLLLLFAAVGALLMIACMNVANIMIARTAERRREIAVRAALGAGRARIGRQFLIESLLVAGIGGIVGCLLAIWGVEAIGSLVPGDLPRANEIGVDIRVLGFAVLISLAPGLMLGLAQGWLGWKIDLTVPLRANERTASESRAGRRLSNLLIVGEIAAAMILLTGGGLFMQSFWRLTQSDPGFDPRNVLTFEVSWPYDKHPQPAPAFRELRTRLLAIPGVLAASTGLQLPDRGGPMLNDTLPFVQVEGRPIQPSESLRASVVNTEPGYFRAMGIPLIRGRDFSESEMTGGPLVTIINESLARAYFPNEDPIGKRLNLDSWVLLGESTREIIAVAGDVKHRGLNAEARPLIYIPVWQRPTWVSHIVVKTDGDPLTFVNAIREAVHGFDQDQPVFDVQTLEQRISNSLAQDRFSALLLGIFSAFAMTLAAVGLYGVLSYAVVRRTREVGIRMALGAEVGDVLKLVVSQGMTLVLTGMVIGLAGAIALTQLVDHLLFEITTADPVALAAATVLLTLVAILACWLPARRATHVDPMVTLRHD